MQNQKIKSKINVLSGSRIDEVSNRKNALNLLKNNPIAEAEILSNLGLFINRQSLSRIIFMHELYKKIINVHGVVVEFGVRWGQNLALFQNFRGMYEPFNYNRKIIGFDTFTGFPSTSEKDSSLFKCGDYGVTKDYDSYLEEILNYHESESPVQHIKKYELVKGDAVKTLEEYLKKNPQTIIALAYFDFDLYEPTKKCLELIKDRLTKGSIIGFDELNAKDFAGETEALREVFGLNSLKLERLPISPLQSYAIFE
jgi:hypothetical protein